MSSNGSVLLDSIELGPITLSRWIPSVSVDLVYTGTEIAGDTCRIESFITDPSQDFGGQSSTLAWSGGPNQITLSGEVLSCRTWPAGTYNVTLDYSSSSGASDSATLSLTLATPIVSAPETPNSSVDNTSIRISESKSTSSAEFETMLVAGAIAAILLLLVVFIMVRSRRPPPPPIHVPGMPSMMQGQYGAQVAPLPQPPQPPPPSGYQQGYGQYGGPRGP